MLFDHFSPLSFKLTIYLYLWSQFSMLISFSPVLVCIFFFYAPISTHLNCASLPLVSLVHIVRTWPGMKGLWSAPESLSPTACATVIKLLHWRSVLDSSPLSHAHCQLSSCEWELDKECEMRESWKMESEWEDERKKLHRCSFLHMSSELFSALVYTVSLFKIPTPQKWGSVYFVTEKAPDNFFPQWKS